MVPATLANVNLNFGFGGFLIMSLGGFGLNENFLLVFSSILKFSFQISVNWLNYNSYIFISD